MFEDTILRRKHGLNVADEPQVHISSISMQQNTQSLGSLPAKDTIQHALEEIQKECSSLNNSLDLLLKKISPILSAPSEVMNGLASNTSSFNGKQIVIRENASPLCMQLHEICTLISSIRNDVNNMNNRVNL